MRKEKQWLTKKRKSQRDKEWKKKFEEKVEEAIQNSDFSDSKIKELLAQ
jgi:hypothetical protein